MRDMGIRQGSAAFALPVVVKSDAVYVHEDIQKAEPQDGTGHMDNVYQYHEWIYTPEEYIQLIGGENAALKKELAGISGELASAQLALVEVYEMMGRGDAS